VNDSLRLWAIFSQLLGFIVIFLLRTYEVPGFWQGIVLALMLSSALLIWLIRLYRKNKRLKDRR
jgi:Na+-driven multidrug efflux pump